jgi:hypothetical protein
MQSEKETSVKYKNENMKQVGGMHQLVALLGNMLAAVILLCPYAFRWRHRPRQRIASLALWQ